MQFCFLILLSPTSVSYFLSPTEQWFVLRGNTWYLFNSTTFNAKLLDCTFGYVYKGAIPPAPHPLSLLQSSPLGILPITFFTTAATTPTSSIDGTKLGMLHQSFRFSWTQHKHYQWASLLQLIDTSLRTLHQSFRCSSISDATTVPLPPQTSLIPFCTDCSYFFF